MSVTAFVSRSKPKVRLCARPHACADAGRPSSRVPRCQPSELVQKLLFQLPTQLWQVVQFTRNTTSSSYFADGTTALGPLRPLSARNPSPTTCADVFAATSRTRYLRRQYPDEQWSSHAPECHLPMNAFHESV